MQRLESSDESKWRCRIIPHRTIISASQTSNSSVVLRLGDPEESKRENTGSEEMEVDYVFTATGYVRNVHEDMLSEVRHLLPTEVQKEGKFKVRRDYSVILDGEKVDEGAGVWLQGCNEGTHGVSSPSTFSPFQPFETGEKLILRQLSDTLLSILAVRGGELVRSIFGDAGAASGASEV
jgi:L-ornithine N5-oxygenase